MWASLGFTKSTYNLLHAGNDVPCYAALSSLLLNIAVSVVLSLLLNAFAANRSDASVGADYL